MAMVSIAISFFIIIIAVAVSSGFRTEIRNGISYISGDIRITRPDMNFAGTAEPLSMNSYALEGLDSIEGVAEVIPAVYRAGIVKNDDKICGVVFKGTKAGGDSLKVSIPSRLADILDLEVGDPILAYIRVFYQETIIFLFSADFPIFKGLMVGVKMKYRQKRLFLKENIKTRL